MTTLTIRNVEPELKELLRVRAARHGPVDGDRVAPYPERGARCREAATGPNLAEAIRRRFLPLGGADEIEPHPPVPAGEPRRFEQ